MQHCCELPRYRFHDIRGPQKVYRVERTALSRLLEILRVVFEIYRVEMQNVSQEME